MARAGFDQLGLIQEMSYGIPDKLMADGSTQLQVWSDWQEDSDLLFFACMSSSEGKPLDNTRDPLTIIDVRLNPKPDVVFNIGAPVASDCTRNQQ